MRFHTTTSEWIVIILLAVMSIAYTKLVGLDSRVFHPSAGVSARRTSHARISTNDPPIPPVAPLVWDQTEGAYMVVLTVGDNPVELVLDTGSSQLSVKGDGCRWRSCDGGDCRVQACPCGVGPDGRAREDCSNHQYNPTGVRVAPGEHGTGTSTVMTYGSQVDTIEHYIDTVALRVAPPGVTCEQLVRGGRLRWDDAASSTLTAPRPVVVHRVLHIDGTSSSNLLGLSRPGGGGVEHGYTVVLDAILEKTQVWSLVFHGNSGWLVMGALPCVPGVNYVPLVQPAVFKNFLTSFYIVEIESVFAEVNGRMRAVRDPPRWCIVDTGTTSTYASTSFGKSLGVAGYVDGTSGLELRLRGKTNPVVLTYSAAQLLDPEYPGTTVVQAWPGRTLDDYDQIFPPSYGGVLLLGALMMKDLYLEFDLAGGRLGVANLG